MKCKIKLLIFLFTLPFFLIAQEKKCDTAKEESFEDIGNITKCSLNDDSSKGQFKVQVSMQKRYLKKRKKTNSMLAKANLNSFLNKMSSKNIKSSHKFETVDVVPGFSKCQGVKDGERLKCFNTQMMKHVEKYFNYPDEAVMKKIQGEVWVRFIIDTNGNISNIKAIVSSIRRLGKKEIRRTTAKDFYNALSDLPDINMYNQSSSLQVPNTRGFTIAKNFRFIQLVDGMDNIIPSDNMYGNLVGAIGLDVANVEVLPGASSALYGSNAFNGAILMTSKNPFDETGISIKTTGGVTTQDNVDEAKGFHDLQARLAYRFTDYFAASASFSHGGGEEWHAQDYRQKIGGIVVEGDLTGGDSYYNGVNIYGDENNYNTKLGAFNKLLTGLISLEDYDKTVAYNVTRTAYLEDALLENHYGNRKFHASLHFRPLKNDKLNIIWRSKFNNADPFIFHGVGGRYENSLNHSTHLLEVNSDVFFVRSYYSSFDINYKSTELLGFKLNNSVMSDDEWFNIYSDNIQQNLNDEKARTFADTNSLVPGTAKFNQVKSRLNSTDVNDGGLFLLKNQISCIMRVI